MNLCINALNYGTIAASIIGGLLIKEVSSKVNYRCFKFAYVNKRLD